TSTSTVGFPRESRIWRAWISAIVATARGRLVGCGAASEPLRRAPQRQLRVDPKPPGDVDEREERLAEPPLGGLLRARVRQPLRGLEPAEPRRRGAPLVLARTEPRGPAPRDVG